MESKPKRVISALFGSRGLYIASALAVLAVGAAGYAALSPAETAPPADLSLPAGDRLETVVSDEIPQDISEDIPPIEVPEPSLPAAAPQAVELPEVQVEPEAPVLILRPLDGEVVAAFSMDTLVYDVTMEDWRVHNGIDIAANLGAEVCAACSGTVLSIKDDALMGITVTVEGQDGCVTTYANLAADPPVAAGDAVAAGQVIGLVGATSKAEAAAPPHLHFSVWQNGKAVDPAEYLSH